MTDTVLQNGEIYAAGYQPDQKSVWVFGYEFTVRLVDVGKIGGNAGGANLALQEIGIDDNQCISGRASTLLHEMLHMACRLMGLVFEEDVIVRLETMIFTLMQDNGIDLEPLYDKVR